MLLTDSGGSPTLQLHDANESVSSDGAKLILTSNGVAFAMPTADGSNGQQLTTDGSGTLSWAAAGGGGGGGGGGTTINNNADNRIITGSGTSATLEGEANFTYDGNDVTITSSTSAKPELILKTTNTTKTTSSRLVFFKDAGNVETDEVLGDIIFKGENDAGSPEVINYARIKTQVADTTDGAEIGRIKLNVMHSGSAVDVLDILGQSATLTTVNGTMITADTDAELVALTLRNESDSDNTNGKVSMRFDLEATDGSTVDSGKIAVKKEQSFTSTASTQDSEMVFSTSLNGTLTEQATISSAGYFYSSVVTTKPSGIGNASDYKVTITKIGALIYTEIFVDLQGLKNTAGGLFVGGLGTVIADNGETSNCYIYQITDSANGFIMDFTYTCLETTTLASGDQDALNFLLSSDGGVNSGATKAIETNGNTTNGQNTPLYALKGNFVTPPFGPAAGNGPYLDGSYLLAGNNAPIYYNDASDVWQPYDTNNKYLYLTNEGLSTGGGSGGGTALFTAGKVMIKIVGTSI